MFNPMAVLFLVIYFAYYGILFYHSFYNQKEERAFPFRYLFYLATPLSVLILVLLIGYITIFLISNQDINDLTSRNGRLTITEARITGKDINPLVITDDQELSDLLKMFKNSRYYDDYLHSPIKSESDSYTTMDVSFVLSNDSKMNGSFRFNGEDLGRGFFRENRTEGYDGYLLEVPGEIALKLKNATQSKMDRGSTGQSTPQRPPNFP